MENLKKERKNSTDFLKNVKTKRMNKYERIKYNANESNKGKIRQMSSKSNPKSGQEFEISQGLF